MWYIDIARSELGEALTSRRIALSSRLEPLSDRPNDAIPARMVRLMWREPPDALLFPPVVMSVPEKEIRECLAWCTTYVGPLAPITAYTRVVSAEAMSGLRNRPDQGNVESWFIAITMAMSEAMIVAQSTQHHSADISLADILGTYSFANGRAESLGLSQRDWNIEDRWGELVRLSGRPQGSHSRALQHVWRVAAEQCGRHHAHSRNRLFPIDDSSSGDASPFVALRRLGLSLSEVMRDVNSAELTSAMVGTREERIDYFHRTVRRMAVERNTAVHGDLRCGFLASLLSLGTMEYLPLAVSMSPVFPEAPFWYAVCVALYAANSPQGEAFLSDNRGLARRILRELCAPAELSEPSPADISLDELAMVGSDRSAIGEVYRSGESSLKVELAPFVYVNVELAASRGLQEHSDADDRRDRMLQEWLSALDAQIGGLESLLRNRPGQRSESRFKGRRKK